MSDETKMSPPEVMDDEIDLRKYIDILIAWRWEILAMTVTGALLAAAAVIGLRFLQAPAYTATSTVAIARTSSNINFDENFQTTLNEQNLTTAARADVLVNTRRAALVGLVANGAVAEVVAATLDSSFEEEERVPRGLMGRIEAEAVVAPGSRTEGDLIQITASADTPEKAAALANAWAHAYVEHVNRLYGEVPETLVASVQNEQSQAQTNYDSAQRALEAFVADNELDRIERLLVEKREIINTMQVGRQTAVKVIIEEELAARRQIISAYINAISSNRLLAFNKEQEGKRGLLTALIDTENSNRLNALQQDQSVRRQLFNQYVEAELQNLLLAFSTDQAARRQVFSQYTDAQLGNLLLALATDQDARRKLFEQYSTTQVNNMLLALSQDQEIRQRLFKQYADAEVENRLLAFSQDQAIRQRIFNAYVESLVSNQLVAIQKDQESRARLFAQYVDTEIANRLKALEAEQATKGAIFDAFVNADTNSKLAVFNEQVNANLRALGNYYATRLKLESLRRDADGLRSQVRQGGENGAATNTLALLLLKTEVYLAAGVEQTSDLQLVLNDLSGLTPGQEGQQADLDALVQVIDDRISELNNLIEEHSRQVFDNQGYNLLDASRPGDDPLFAALQEKYLDLFELDSLAQQVDQLDNATLSQAILTRYDALFAPTALAQAADSAWRESDLLAAVQSKYEELFTLGVLATGTDRTPEELSGAVADRYTELFTLGNLTEIAGGMNESELSAAILAKYQELFALGELASAESGNMLIGAPIVTGALSAGIPVTDTASLTDTLGSLVESNAITGTVAMESELAQAILIKYEELFGLGDLSQSASPASATDLSAAIGARYQDLFGMGTVASSALVFSDTTPIFQAIQEQYPEIFDIGALSGLSDLIADNNELALMTNELARELLQLQGLEELPAFTASDAPLTQAIDQLEQEVKQLQAQREAEISRRDQLTRMRDLALKSLTTLNSKIAELQLASTALTSEVRFASPALPPLRPEERTSLVMATALGALVGLMLGVFVAFFASYMGKQPFFQRQGPATA